jgi:hypothetical protein
MHIQQHALDCYRDKRELEVLKYVPIDVISVIKYFLDELKCPENVKRH